MCVLDGRLCVQWEDFLRKLDVIDNLLKFLRNHFTILKNAYTFFRDDYISWKITTGSETTFINKIHVIQESNYYSFMEMHLIWIFMLSRSSQLFLKRRLIHYNDYIFMEKFLTFLSCSFVFSECACVLRDIVSLLSSKQRMEGMMKKLKTKNFFFTKLTPDNNYNTLI